MMYPLVFDRSTTALGLPLEQQVTQALGTLKEAYNVAIKQRINGAHTVSFDMPRPSASWAFIKNENVVLVDGEYYVIKIVNDGRDESGRPYGRVTAIQAFWDVAENDKHIPKIHYRGLSPRGIFNAAFENFPEVYGVQIQQLTDAEITELGMEPMTTLTDVQADKTNPLAVISTVIKNVGGELYVKGFMFALVKKNGRESGVKFTIDKNLKGVDRNCDTTNLVTRLYPYSKESFELDSLTGGDYIDSPYIDKYDRIYSGYKDYRDITDPATLLEWAKREFSTDNFDRIDIPRLIYQCSIVDLWKMREYGDVYKIGVGDTVLLFDGPLEIDVITRVVEYDYYPYEPTKSYIALGNPPKTVYQLLSKLLPAGHGTDNYVSWPEFEGVVEDIKNNIDGTVGEEKIEEMVNNYLAEHPPGGGGLKLTRYI